MANQCGAPHCKIVFAEECNGSEDDPEDVMNDDGEIINDAGVADKESTAVETLSFLFST